MKRTHRFRALRNLLLLVMALFGLWWVRGFPLPTLELELHRAERQVLAEDAEYPYLQPSARTLLQRARELARQQRLLERRVLPRSGRAFCLCPWTGTKELQTIERLLSCGLKAPLKVLGVVNRRHFLIVESGLEAETFVRELRNIEVDSDDPASVLPENHAPRVDKYDWMVPEPLLRTAFLYNQMDIPAALGVLRDIGSDC